MCLSCNQVKGEQDEKVLQAKHQANKTGQWYAITVGGEVVTASWARESNTPVTQYISPDLRNNEIGSVHKYNDW